MRTDVHKTKAPPREASTSATMTDVERSSKDGSLGSGRSEGTKKAALRS